MIATNRVQELTEKSNEMSRETERLRNANERLQEQLQQLSEKKAAYSKSQWEEFEVVAGELQTARSSIAELQLENRQLQSELEQLRKQSSPTEHRKAEKLKEEYKEAQGKLKICEKERDALRAALRKEELHVSELEKELQDLRMVSADSHPVAHLVSSPRLSTQRIDQPVDLEEKLAEALEQNEAKTSELNRIREENRRMFECIKEFQCGSKCNLDVDAELGGLLRCDSPHGASWENQLDYLAHALQNVLV